MTDKLYWHDDLVSNGCPSGIYERVCREGEPPHDPELRFLKIDNKTFVWIHNPYYDFMEQMGKHFEFRSVYRLVNLEESATEFASAPTPLGVFGGNVLAEPNS